MFDVHFFSLSEKVTTLNSTRISSVNMPVSANRLAQVSAKPNNVVGESSPQVAGQTKSAVDIKQKAKPDLLENLKAIEAQIEARAKEATNVNALDIAYNKKEALLSVKVEQKQTGDLVRELQFKDYKAMAYSSHGYKGINVDITS